MSTPSENQPRNQSFSLVRVLLVAVPLGILCGWVMKSYWPQHIEAEMTRSGQEKLRQLIFTENANVRLDRRFTDADGDLVADCPKDPAKQISPATLVFAYVGGPDADKGKEDWQPFADAVSKKTGKKVDIVSFKTIGEEIEALNTGKLHIAGFNTGAVTSAVNRAGFVPVCAPGKADNTFGIRMEIIVPAKSAIQSLADLHGHTITFTDRDSNSGYKAALLKMHLAKLDPETDYSLRFSGSHNDSIKLINDGESEAAPVASDLLQRAVAEGAIGKENFRVIAESESFPPAVLGYVYNLKPELADQIRDALLGFSWSGPPMSHQFYDATHFVSISFDKDFKLIREIEATVKAAPDPSTIVEPPSGQDTTGNADPAQKST